MAKKLTKSKAREILHDKEVHGHPLTDKQRKFFGAIAGGAKPYKAQIGTQLTALPINFAERLSDVLSFPQKAITKLFTGEYQTPSEAMGIKNKLGAFATDAVLDPVNLLLGAGSAKAASKVSKVATKSNIAPILSQEEAIRARAQRMLEQESKWRGQDNATLRNKFETAVERHNPASDYPGERIGANTGEATQISRHANLSDANKARMAAHEVGHYYHNAVEEANAWNKYFDWSVLDNLGIEKIHKIRQYLTGSKPSLMSHYPGQTAPSGVLNQWKPKGVPSGDELRERAAQLKDYIAYKNNIPLNKDFKITRSQLDDAVKSYVKETGLDNNMTPFLEALKKKRNISGFLKEMNKRPLVIAPAVLAGAETIEQKQDGGWLDKYDAPQAQNGIEGTMGGLTDIGFKHNGAWGGAWRDGGTLQPPMAGAPQPSPLMQMGGSLPGAVGFMYARTQSPAPSNGPYAKKTKASAQNGQEMKYYQEGLDFTPKTISQNGSAITTDINDYRRWQDSVRNYIRGQKDLAKARADVKKNINTFSLMSGSGLVGAFSNLIQGDYQGKRRFLPKYTEQSLPRQYWGPSQYPQVPKDVIVVGDPAFDTSKRIKGLTESLDENKNLTETNMLTYSSAVEIYHPPVRRSLKYQPPVKKQQTSKTTGPLPIIETPRRGKYVPIPKEEIDLGYELPVPNAPSPLKASQFENKPTKYTFTYPTGKYNEQKTMYFPSKSALKSFVGGVRGATYQEGADYASATGTLQDGGDIPVDPMGYWNPENVGNPVIIPSNTITMKGVDRRLVGISDTGDVQYMEPGQDYQFDGEYVTEYPVAKGGISVNEADAQPLKKLDQLLNFTNYNKPTKGGWLDKYN